MARYRGTSRIHSTRGLLNLDAYGQSSDLLEKTARSRSIARRAARMPDVGSNEAHQRWGPGFRNRYYKMLRRELKRRNDGRDPHDIVQKTMDKVDKVSDRLARAEYHAEWLMFARDVLGSDMADIALAVLAEYLRQLIQNLWDEFEQTMYQFWFSFQMDMNNGQITIAELYYLPEIADFMQENDPETGTQGLWPHQTDLFQYYDRIVMAHDQDIFARAFTITTEAPMEPCETIREMAVGASNLLASITGFW